MLFEDVERPRVLGHTPNWAAGFVAGGSWPGNDESSSSGPKLLLYRGCSTGFSWD